MSTEARSSLSVLSVRLVAGAIVALFVLSVGSSPPARVATNPIAAENALTGSPPLEWDLPPADIATPQIEGFASDISINAGDAVSFRINTSASNYTIGIYRLGYYGGLGARRVA